MLHNLGMNLVRAFLLEALQRVADGGDIDMTELDTAVPNPRSLDRHEKSAWEELSHWADDGDIRERDQRYAQLKRERMSDHAAALTANGR